MKILLVHGTEKISGGNKVSLNIAKNLRSKIKFIFPSAKLKEKEFSKDLRFIIQRK